MPQSINDTTLCHDTTYNVIQGLCIIYIWLPGRELNPGLLHDRRGYLPLYYIEFMKELTSKGYAKESSKVAESGHYWYLLHHGVYHFNKPRKIRVVFDLSAEHHGVSINKELLPGPDLTNQIVGVLLRFREEPIAVTRDMEAMFQQVKIPEKQRNYLRFLW